MPELLEETTAEPTDLPRLIGLVRRRQMQFLIPFFCGWLLVWGATWIVPPRYKSTTTILVEQPSMQQNYIVPNIDDDLQTRLQTISEQILSRTRLLLIIDKLHLYSSGKLPPSPDAQAERMRKDIDVELVRNPSGGLISGFKVSYTSRDPRLAQQVTGELTNLFISENLKVREAQSQGTTSFIGTQLEAARAALADQEQKVRQFQGQHEGALPEQQASNLQILSGLQSQLQGEQDALNTAKQQRVYLQAVLEETRNAASKTQTASNATGTPVPNNLATIDDQIQKMRAQLAELSARYTDRYPDVLNLKNQIAKAEATRSSLIASGKQSGAATQAGENVEPATSTEVRQVQGQLQANQLEIANREQAIRELQGRIGEYQGRLNAQPATQQQLADLTRGYEQSKANYDDLLKKRDQSQMATSMEQMQQGDRFTMLDPPSLPISPDFPNRLKFCGIGLVAGLFFGLIAAVGFEVLDDRLHTEKEIKALLPMAVILEIPEIVSSLDEEHAQKKAALVWATTAIVLVLIFAGAVFSYLHG